MHAHRESPTRSRIRLSWAFALGVCGIAWPAVRVRAAEGTQASPATASSLLPSSPWFALNGSDAAASSGSEKYSTGTESCARDRSLGTALKWECSPSSAFARAEADHKLVFLIEVSGNFERPGFT